MNIEKIEEAICDEFYILQYSPRREWGMRSVFLPEQALAEAAEKGRLKELLLDVKRQLPEGAAIIRAPLVNQSGVKMSLAGDGWRIVFISPEWPPHKGNCIPEIGLKF